LEGDNSDSQVLLSVIRRLPTNRPKLKVQYATGEELEAHEKRLHDIQKTSDGKCVWLN